MNQSTFSTLNKVGWGLISLCLLILLIGMNWQVLHLDRELPQAMFMAVYIITVVYAAFVWGHNRMTHRPRNYFKGDPRLYANALTLFSISAHSLNYLTEIQVFALYRPEIMVYVVLMHLGILLFPYRKSFPEWGQYATYFLMGAGLVFSLYQLAFLGPLVVWAFPLGLLLGVSLHATVPLWYAIEFVWAIWRMEDLRWSRAAYWAGVLIPCLLLFGFLTKWHQVQQTIETQSQTFAQTEALDLPQWAWLSQHLPEGAFTERVLTSPMVAQRPFWGDGRGWNIMASSNFRQEGLTRQDPLAVVAGWCYGPLGIEDDVLLATLESRYDIRHQTHRRLWRGKHLKTNTIDTRVKLYPEFRMAYVEKELTIQNINNREWSQQEAVYTFHLPEGGIATSLSLWVEGEERPARLTTKGKADSAYVQIVGHERRDPALMHWQEGNRLTVTVFPCTPQENRRFKVGISVPLAEEQGRLFLREIPFDGPSVTLTSAETTVEVANGNPDDLSIPLDWRKKSEGVGYAGRYDPDWRISLKAPPLSNASFSFQGYHYSLEASQPSMEAFSPEIILLDLNREWNWLEVQAVWELVKEKEVFAYVPAEVRLTEENLWPTFQQVQQQQFSLPPLYRLNQPANTLVISHSPENSPLLHDLEGSTYASKMGEFLAGNEGRIHWYNLGKAVSPLLKSLKELRLLHYAEGDLDQLQGHLLQQEFPQINETEDLAHLPAAGLNLRRTEGELAASGAPDHLLRFFAYQQLLRSIGPHYFEREALEESWIKTAEHAFVVSPISSLVVLETQEDYERFDIDENENTLGNANLSGDGSVPEPHEWVLIGLIGLVLGWQLLRNRGWL
jgi:XrtN system VIT domain protein